MKAGYIAIAMALIIAAMPLAYAEKGVGIKWYTEAEIIPEETTRCIEYGMYNPWDTDVSAVLKSSVEFSDVVEKQESEPVFIEAETWSTNAYSSSICFTIGDVYEEDCLIGDWFCERKCPSERYEYKGQVIVEEAPQDASLGGTGSGTVFGVAAPLRLIVDCEDKERDITPLYYAGGIVAGLVVFAAAKRHHNKGRKGRKRKPHFVIKI